MKRLCILILGAIFTLSSVATALAFDDILPENAYDMLNTESTSNNPDNSSNNPDNSSSNSNTYILDVRTPDEYCWVGHPGEDNCGNGAFLVGKVVHIPFKLWVFDAKTQQYVKELNKFFDEEVVRRFNPGDTIILMCRSGGRSVDAANELEADSVRAAKRLEELDLYYIYNMIEGFEGGRNKDDCKHRTLEQGWKNKGLPYIDNDAGIWKPRQKGRSLE
jgi:rhodanese-related sulfurtransferase